MRRAVILISLIIIILTGSCAKIQHLPPEPYIEYRSFAVFDTIDILGNNCKGGRLKFYFQDGDGNLGLASPEETGQDTTNLFFILYRKTGGVMTEVPDNDPMKPSPYRIPYMSREGQNKILKGTISVTFIYLFYEREDNDTFMYEFYLKDRAENFSNTVSTTEIPLSVNGVY
ncbi:MAG: hypothetical protein A2V64_00740 [Bacteroidetes bacterium RBG_13_43_22]|nr:MAG: hypothetical protein A2V64_00740 [Bacteroidetes bacterium RBG_13_43_22]